MMGAGERIGNRGMCQCSDYLGPGPFHSIYTYANFRPLPECLTLE